MRLTTYEYDVKRLRWSENLIYWSCSSNGYPLPLTIWSSDEHENFYDTKKFLLYLSHVTHGMYLILFI